MRRQNTATTELRSAFETIVGQKLQEWDEANPEPINTPDITEYAREIEAGKAKVNISLLRECDYDFSRKLLCEFISTPSSEAAAKAHASWKTARKHFERKINTARDQYFQRIQFGGGDAVSLLEDFRNFTPKTNTP